MVPMLYLIELNHSPQQCPGVALEIRDRVLRMSETWEQVMESHGCSCQGGWVGKSTHVTFLVIDAPSAHAVDDAMVDLGLAVWNTTTMYPVITLEEAAESLRGI
jgi:hypothetical protein